MELGNYPEGIRETKNDLRQQYINTIKRLALQKMKNDLWFEGTLGATIRRFSSLGLDVSRESILKDIQQEISSQRTAFDLHNAATDTLFSLDGIQQRMSSVNQRQQQIKQQEQQIEQIKNNLGNIFATPAVQEQSVPTPPAAIPREPAMQSPDNYKIPRNNIEQQVPVYTEQKQQEIRAQVQQVQDEVSQKLEWASQQPNEPAIAFTGDLANLPNDIKQKIIQQMEARGEVIISGIDNIYQEGNYIVVDAKDNQGRFTGAEFTLDDFSKLINQPSSNIIPNESQIVSQIPQQKAENVSNGIQQPVQYEQPQSAQSLSEDEPEQVLHQQEAQIKSALIQQIMHAMNQAGEFSFGDISISERMSIMKNVETKLNNKSTDELQTLLSTYQTQNVQEDTMHSERHR